MRPGELDIEKIREEVIEGKYQYEQAIVDKLLMNKETMNVVYEFYKMQNPEYLQEMELSKTVEELIYGISEDTRTNSHTEEIMQAISVHDINRRVMSSNTLINSVLLFGEEIRQRMDTINRN